MAPIFSGWWGQRAAGLGGVAPRAVVVREAWEGQRPGGTGGSRYLSKASLRAVAGEGSLAGRRTQRGVVVLRAAS